MRLARPPSDFGRVWIWQAKYQVKDAG